MSDVRLRKPVLARALSLWGKRIPARARTSSRLFRCGLYLLLLSSLRHTSLLHTLVFKVKLEPLGTRSTDDGHDEWVTPEVRAPLVRGRTYF